MQLGDLGFNQAGGQAVAEQLLEAVHGVFRDTTSMIARFIFPSRHAPLGHITLIMDRHPVHRAKIVQSYLKQNNVKFLYLPAYSPELNPIEEAFSKIKQYIKKHKARTVDELLKVLKKAFDIITFNDAKGILIMPQNFKK